ncbi:MAG TPA: PadR family transcriptional regulator [Gemmatimonadaceae bacterium]|nr:PadR family transcriptional regulator [Gemmatimonadaceae bacterium]
MPADRKDEILPGTLEMLVLKTLSLGALHGYGIAQHIRQLSKEVLQVEEGSLYPALQRMELKGLVSAEWKLTPTKRRARYYKLTPAGRKQLGVEQSSFARLVEAISSVMQPENQE